MVKRRRPDGVATIALAVGTQFPDLVDKPLTWTFTVLPNGRSLTHSLFTAILIIIVLEALLRLRGYGRVATAFAVGYLSHLFGDALYPALNGNRHALGFLAWPIVPPIEYATEPSFMAHFRKLSLESIATFELALGGVMFLLWLADGAPGLGVVWAIPKWFGRKLSV